MGWGAGQKFGHIKRVSHAGISFASKLEAATFDLLTMLNRGKEIVCQKHIKLTPANIVYIVDFVIIENGEPVLYAEAKGFETPEWKIKKRLWPYFGPGTLEIYGGNWKSPKLIEVLHRVGI